MAAFLSPALPNFMRIDHFLLYVLLGRNWRKKTWTTKRDLARVESLQRVLMAPVLCDQWRLSPFRIVVDTPYPAFNPGLLKTDGGWLAVVRSSNLINYNDGDYVYASQPHDAQNFVLKLPASEPGIVAQNRLDDSILRVPGSPAEYGIEDARLFVWRNETWGIGAGIRPFNAQGELATTQILFRLEGGRITSFEPLVSPYGRRVEKNWVPLVDGDRLVFIYSYAPLVLLEYRSGRLEMLHEQAASSGNTFSLRGGTPMVPWKDGFVSLAHTERIELDGKRYYLHCFVRMNKSFRITEVSEHFFLQRRGIEFASGLASAGESLIVAYGVADQTGYMMELPEEVVRRYLVT
jgi:predicted GH43/DUF377 family glycosyl hydrolase